MYDYFGIRFVGHPDMRRLFLREDWIGHPLRKDYDESLNPLRMTNEEPVDTTQYMEVQHDGSVIEKRETIFDEDEYIINIGPQHPATHGVLRFACHWSEDYKETGCTLRIYPPRHRKRCAKV